MQTQIEDKLRTQLCQSIIFLYLLITSTICSIHGLELKCTCTTRDCIRRGLSTCSTAGICFTQFLDHKDGSDSLIRGCIDTKTSLLCENMRPAVPFNKWPLLACCDDSDMCNDQVVPTLPASELGKVNAMGKKINITNAISEDEDFGGGGVITLLSTPVYISVVVVGIVLLILIGLTAICILRGQQRLYRRQWSIDRDNYEKGRHTIIPAVEVATKAPNDKYSQKQIPLLESVKTLST